MILRSHGTPFRHYNILGDLFAGRHDATLPRLDYMHWRASRSPFARAQLPDVDAAACAHCSPVTTTTHENAVMLAQLRLVSQLPRGDSGHPRDKIEASMAPSFRVLFCREYHGCQRSVTCSLHVVVGQVVLGDGRLSQLAAPDAAALVGLRGYVFCAEHTATRDDRRACLQCLA